MDGRSDLHALLEDLYGRYNRRTHAAEDPISFLYGCPDANRREVVGIIAASLAYGGLIQIMRSVRNALDRLGSDPREFLLSSPPQKLREACDGFVHRVVNADRLWRLLWALKDVLASYGSLRKCFAAHDDPHALTILPGLRGLADQLRRSGRAPKHLIADPCGAGACKRWHLFLRWMVRLDAVDPGGWEQVRPSRLVVPLDAHTWRMWRALGLTARRTCGLNAALEVTQHLRQHWPDDPVRHDFALMHASARKDPGLAAYLASHRSR
jgi:uncharacterized protein (TIGR02757 family)